MGQDFWDLRYAKITIDADNLLTGVEYFERSSARMAKWGEGDPRWIVEERPGKNLYAVCPRSSDPFYMVSYFINGSLRLGQLLYMIILFSTKGNNR